jgi:predicted nucleic-acid-binding Zn-ribbon protein
MSFITIKESNNSADLVVLKSKLESEGVRCRIDGELSNQVLNYIPLISVRLQVFEEDMELVRTIMIENGEWEKNKPSLICPKCKSTEIKIALNLKNLFKIFGALFIAIFMIKPGYSMY